MPRNNGGATCRMRPGGVVVEPGSCCGRRWTGRCCGRSRGRGRWCSWKRRGCRRRCGWQRRWCGWRGGRRWIGWGSGGRGRGCRRCRRWCGGRGGGRRRLGRGSSRRPCRKLERQFQCPGQHERILDQQRGRCVPERCAGRERAAGGNCAGSLPGPDMVQHANRMAACPAAPKQRLRRLPRLAVWLREGPRGAGFERAMVVNPRSSALFAVPSEAQIRVGLFNSTPQEVRQIRKLCSQILSRPGMFDRPRVNACRIIRGLLG